MDSGGEPTLADEAGGFVFICLECLPRLRGQHRVRAIEASVIPHRCGGCGEITCEDGALVEEDAFLFGFDHDAGAEAETEGLTSAERAHWEARAATLASEMGAGECLELARAFGTVATVQGGRDGACSREIAKIFSGAQGAERGAA